MVVVAVAVVVVGVAVVVAKVVVVVPGGAGVVVVMSRCVISSFLSVTLDIWPFTLENSNFSSNVGGVNAFVEAVAVVGVVVAEGGSVDVSTAAG